MIWQAPAKLNLSLHVDPPRADGMHPLQSIVQTIEWCDVLTVELGDGGDELESDIEDNLVLRALKGLRDVVEVPPLAMSLAKEIPVEAGLGGGSSDAAAALKAAGVIAGVPDGTVRDVASRIGADVSLFLEGGTVLMSGVGESLGQMPPLTDFAVAVVIPEFGISTAEAYQRWDEMEGPQGESVPDDLLPPSLRGGMPMRNDLLPAALDLRPELGDFLADLRAVWGGAACLTGSGSACFGYFPTVDEAAGAVDAAGVNGRGVGLRGFGVAEI